MCNIMSHVAKAKNSINNGFLTFSNMASGFLLSIEK